MTVLDGYEAGDPAVLRLHVVPDGGVPTDGTTVAELTLVDPDGAPVPLTAVAAGEDRSRWSATIPSLSAGVYVGRWRVTGTGAGVEPVRILVGPSGSTPYRGRSYATTAHLAEHLGAAPPADAHRLLVRATERVDELLRTAVYATTGADELPVDDDVILALREATCAQAAWFDDTGDDGSGLAARWSDVQIGSVRLSGSTGGSGGGGDPDGSDPRYAPGAIRALRKVPGLYGGAPAVCW